MTMGITENNKAKEKAGDFVDFALSEDVQGEIKYVGLPVNKNVMKNKLGALESDEFEVETELGSAKEMSYTKLSDEQINAWMDIFECTQCIELTDEKVFRIIMKEAKKVVAGKETPNDAAKEAYRIINLYLDE